MDHVQAAEIKDCLHTKSTQWRGADRPDKVEAQVEADVVDPIEMVQERMMAFAMTLIVIRSPLLIIVCTFTPVLPL
jgi:hypothetical protein